MTLKIITWNVNSVKSRLSHLQELIAETNPDIILLQEIKCLTENFPYEELSNFSYNYYVQGEKSYNGVAILSKFPADEIIYNFPNNPLPHQSRFLEITCNTPIGFIRVICLYAPNGGEVDSDKFIAKLAFYDELTAYLASKKDFDEKLIIGGDFNIAPFDIDVHSPSSLQDSTCFTLREKIKFRSLLNSGFNDLYRLANPDKGDFTWWDYRAGSFGRNLGMRIDMIIGNANSVDRLSKCYHYPIMRQKEKPSDHAPVIAEFIKE